MYDRRRFFVWLTAIFALTLVPPFYYLVRQYKEDKIVEEYMAEHQLQNLRVSKAAATSIARQVAADFNVKPETFQWLKMDNRPFLREDAGFLLTHKEGRCGEVARVIVRLLNANGFDATRVNLYDRYMQFPHTLVSVQLGKEHFWIDTIISKYNLRNLLENKDISEDNFRYLAYSDKVSDRREKVGVHHDVDEAEEFRKNSDDYFLYSFESVPFTKLLSKVGIEKRVFNHRRPPHFISVLAEKPNMIMFWICLFGALVVTLLSVKPLRRLLKKEG